MAPELQPRLRSRRDAPAGGALPPDLVREILLRLPAADACRLRAICRLWRALLADPLFATAHAARHPGPLVAVGYDASLGTGRVLCDIVDLSGRVVKRVRSAGPGPEREWVMCAHGDHLCVARGSSMSCHLLSLTTGAVHALPQGLAAEHARHRQDFSDCWASAAFGLVPSIGQYKVLRVLHSFRYHPVAKLYEVVTIDGSSQARWRGKRAPPYPVELGDWYSVVVQHTVYFLLSDHDSGRANKQGLVASFDLETEKWGASIAGPLSTLRDDDDYDYYSFFTNRLSCFNFKIAALGECLALGCRRPSPGASPSMDLWLLRDDGSGKGSCWVKQHSIETSVLYVAHLAQPLLVLNDGRIANHVGDWAFLKNYEQEIKASTDDLEMKICVAVGLYGGNLLSLPNGTR